jgi:hypothetical protein
MQGVAPPPYTLDNPVVKVLSDLREQGRASRRGPLPPGPTRISLVRDLSFVRDPAGSVTSSYRLTVAYIAGLLSVHPRPPRAWDTNAG